MADVDIAERARLDMTVERLHRATELARGLGRRAQAVRRWQRLARGPYGREAESFPGRCQKMLAGEARSVRYRPEHGASLTGTRRRDAERVLRICGRWNLGHRRGSYPASGSSPGAVSNQRPGALIMAAAAAAATILLLDGSGRSFHAGFLPLRVCAMSVNGRRHRKPEPYRNGKNCAPVESDGDAPYSREHLLKMDSLFVAAMERAIARGLERRPDGDPARAA